MTGSSLDGIDIAVVEIRGSGLEMQATLVDQGSRSLGRLGPVLREIAEQHPVSAEAICSVAHALSDLHAQALAEICAGHDIDFVCVHGQTIFHRPPLSWQLLQPSLIVRTLGVPVVWDLRAADLAGGGQGAPITPLADFILFAVRGEHRSVVNLGGFCNLTRLPDDADIGEIAGFDVCACCQVLDGLARSLLQKPWDHDGSRAMAGSVRSAPTEDLSSRLRSQAGSGRSLGTGDELTAWITRHGSAERPEDLLRSACAAIADIIVTRALPADRVILAGGGTRNLALLEEIRSRSPVQVEISDSHGVPISMREATAMAVLGALCADRVPITLPQVTGVCMPSPVAGSWVLP